MSHCVALDRDTASLLPPSVNGWLPASHLARFVVEVIGQMDLGALTRQGGGRGSAAHHPAVLLGLLVEGYASGEPSSRQIRRATDDSVAFRFVAANTHPYHDTLATFRRRFLKEPAGQHCWRAVVAIKRWFGLGAHLGPSDGRARYSCRYTPCTLSLLGHAPTWVPLHSAVIGLQVFKADQRGVLQEHDGLAVLNLAAVDHGERLRAALTRLGCTGRQWCSDGRGRWVLPSLLTLSATKRPSGGGDRCGRPCDRSSLRLKDLWSPPPPRSPHDTHRQ